MTRPDAPIGHEVRDVQFRGVLLAAAGVLVLTLVAFGAMRLLLTSLVAREAADTTPANPLAAQYAPARPPEPRLQETPLKDLQALHAEEDAQLHGYAWVDRAAGRVRIPIERAMALLAVDGERTP